VINTKYLRFLLSEIQLQPLVFGNGDRVVATLSPEGELEVGSVVADGSALNLTENISLLSMQSKLQQLDNSIGRLKSCLLNQGMSLEDRIQCLISADAPL
jgi:hypothetical protein